MIDETIINDKKLLREFIESKTKDPAKYTILERQIFAFYLLEKLIGTKAEFIFKGGTALILLLDVTHRFSTDIDILISRPNLVHLEKRFDDFVSEKNTFFKWEPDIREKSKFPKAHYKFYFNSEYKNEDQEGYIILDCVFEANPYIELFKSKIIKDILPTIGEPIDVLIPSITDIMIDKLTAFAPNTIGVKFERILNDGTIKDHSREVIKQWFDINELYQKCNDLTKLKQRYQKLANFEIEQREIKEDFASCLKDTLNMCLVFLDKGQRDAKNYEKILKGIRRLRFFVNLELTESYLITASVNVVVLISKVFCEDEEEYKKISDESKTIQPYEDFIKNNKLKNIIKLINANSSQDREKFILALRVIFKYIKQ